MHQKMKVLVNDLDTAQDASEHDHEDLGK